jgi:hypothetical protein
MLSVSTETLTRIQALLASSDANRYASGYRLIANEIRQMPEYASSASAKDTVAWIEFAIDVNTGVRNFNTDSVRANNTVAVYRQSGKLISLYGPEQQIASDNIAEAFLGGITDSNGVLPSPLQIFQIDAAQGLEALGISNPGAWAGALPPILLRNTSVLSSDYGYWETLTPHQQQNALYNHTLVIAISVPGQALSVEMMDSLAAGVVENQLYHTLGSAAGVARYILPPRCFLANTPLTMSDGTELLIEQVAVGDMIMCFEPAANQGRGSLVSRPVTRLFHNISQQILDLRGLQMTPGHVCLTDHGHFSTVAAILQRDGCLIDVHGMSLRARTGAALGSTEDALLTVAYDDPLTGQPHLALLRAGIPVATAPSEAGQSRTLSLADLLIQADYGLHPDGSLTLPDGSAADAFNWPPGTSPLDHFDQQQWVTAVDGAPYVPLWVMQLDDSSEHLDAPKNRATVALN